MMLGLAVAALAAACEEDQLDVSLARCPNEQPAAASPCPEPELACSYFTDCDVLVRARCSPDSRWILEGSCPDNTGGGGGRGAAGASASSSMSSAASAGGAGGWGGGGSGGSGGA